MKKCLYHHRSALRILGYKIVFSWCGVLLHVWQAFLVPVIELLSKVKWANRNGTGAVIISPTRELSLQIYGVLRDLCDEGNHPMTHGLVMGKLAIFVCDDGMMASYYIDWLLLCFSFLIRWSKPQSRGRAFSQGSQYPCGHTWSIVGSSPGKWLYTWYIWCRASFDVLLVSSSRS